jgi:O-antigen ligase
MQSASLSVSDSDVGARPGVLGSPAFLQAATAVVIAAALFFGGGTRQALISDALVQLLSLALVAILVVRFLQQGTCASPRLIAVALLAVACVGVFQLLPLPPVLWTKLPGRETVVQGFLTAGIDLPWLPVSLRPDATWRSLLALVPAIAVFAAVLQLGAGTRRLLTLLFVAFGLVSVLLGLAQLMEGPGSSLRFFPVTNVENSVGFFANRNHYAALLYCLIPFVSVWIAEFLADSSPGRIFGLATFLGTYVVLLLGLGMALSRAGVVLALVATVMSLLLFRRLESDVAKRSFTLMGAALLIGGALIVQFAIVGLVARFGTDTLADARLEIARNTWAASQAFVPVGSGLGTFDPVYRMFEPAAELGPTFVYHAHDDWLELWLELGAVGILAVLLFLAWAVPAAVKAWRQPAGGRDTLDRLLPPAGSIVVLLLLLHSFVDYPLRTTALMTTFAFACALMVAPASARRSPARPPSGAAGRIHRTRRMRPAPSLPAYGDDR